MRVSNALIRNALYLSPRPSTISPLKVPTVCTLITTQITRPPSIRFTYQEGEQKSWNEALIIVRKRLKTRAGKPHWVMRKRRREKLGH